MKEPGTKGTTKEFIKSVMMVVLFLSTILLLYVFWEDINPGQMTLGELTEQESVHPLIEPAEVLAPDELQLSYGDGSYGVITGDTRSYWWTSQDPSQGPTFSYSVREFFQEQDIFVEEITEEQYKQVVAMESLKVIFDEALPLEFLCQVYQWECPSATETIQQVSELAYSFGSMESLFVRDKGQGKYYRIIGNGENLEKTPFLSLYQRTAINAHVAYPLSLLMGEAEANPVLVPLPNEFPYTITTYTNERAIGGEDFERSLAKTFFGNTFDFTRIIQDAKGTNTYMYGYGQRVLVATKDGTFRYQEETAVTQDVKLLDSLEIALEFLSKHGGTQGASEEIYALHLSDIQQQASRPSSVRFLFDLWEKSAVRYEGGGALAITVVGEQVVEFTRDFYIPEKTQTQPFSAGDYTAVNVLATNYEQMAAVLMEAGFFQDKREESLSLVLQSIQSIRLAETRFAKTQEGMGKIETCWCFFIEEDGKQMEFYYSIRDALPMGHTFR
ncbi:MAG: hypothetical protein WCX59_02910 [Anaerovoracaceae bacterium]